MAWDDPTGPPVTQEPQVTQTVTVSGSPAVVTATVTERVTLTPSPTEIRTTVTQTVTPSPVIVTDSPKPRATKTVQVTVAPQVQPNPIPSAQPDLSATERPQEFPTVPVPSVASPEQSQIVVNIPTEPVSTEVSPVVWAIIPLAWVIVLTACWISFRRFGRKE